MLRPYVPTGAMSSDDGDDDDDDDDLLLGDSLLIYGH